MQYKPNFLRAAAFAGMLGAAQLASSEVVDETAPYLRKEGVPLESHHLPYENYEKPLEEKSYVPVYIVQSGDCLTRIAKSHGMSLDLLLNYNSDMKKRAPHYLIKPGEKLQLTPTVLVNAGDLYGRIPEEDVGIIDLYVIIDFWDTLGTKKPESEGCTNSDCHYLPEGTPEIDCSNNGCH